MERDRPKRRRLNYNKCVCCRAAKKKCEPIDRIWPGQKCDRCNDLDLPCSENQRASGPRPSTVSLSPAVETVHSSSTEPDMREFLDLSIRVAWLRQLMSFVRSAQVVEIEIVKVHPAAHRTHHRLACLDTLVKHEAGTLVGDIKRFSLNSQSLGNHFTTLSTSYLFLKLGSCRDEADGVYGTLGLCETMDFLPTSVKHSETLGDYGAALMMQETLLIRLRKHRDLDGMADEIRRYLRIHNAFAKRARDVLGLEIPVIPPLHYLVVLTKNNWVIEAAAANSSFPLDRDPLGRDLLHIALDEIPSPEIQPFLDGRMPLGHRDMFGRSALHVACTRGLSLVVRALLNHGAPINIRGPMGWHPLHVAVLDYPTAKLLLDTKDVDPNCEDDFGRTPLYYAALNGPVEIVEAFLDHDRVNPTGLGTYMCVCVCVYAKFIV